MFLFAFITALLIIATIILIPVLGNKSYALKIKIRYAILPIVVLVMMVSVIENGIDSAVVEFIPNLPVSLTAVLFGIVGGLMMVVAFYISNQLATKEELDGGTAHSIAYGVGAYYSIVYCLISAVSNIYVYMNIANSTISDYLTQAGYPIEQIPTLLDRYNQVPALQIFSNFIWCIVVFLAAFVIEHYMSDFKNNKETKALFICFGIAILFRIIYFFAQTLNPVFAFVLSVFVLAVCFVLNVNARE